jgi:hypothetical protein
MMRVAVPLVLFIGLISCSAQHPASAPSPAAAQTTQVSLQGQATPSSPATPRQIIYRANIDLRVPDFGAVDKKIQVLLKESGGYLAQFREDRPYGAIRGGHWTLRVPADRFDQLLDDIASLGVAERREVQADDVTEEYVDLTARLKNKQQLESRLLELVAKRGDEIKDVLAIETELSRVREEIERLQGRLRYLSDRVALTTIEVMAYERHDYRPVEATLIGRIEHTFRASLAGLAQCAEALLLAAVALLPWLVVLAVAAAPLIIWIRRSLRRKPAQIVTASVA